MQNVIFILTVMGYICMRDVYGLNSSSPLSSAEVNIFDIHNCVRCFTHFLSSIESLIVYKFADGPAH